LAAYKNICDGQVGQWIIEEAKKVEGMAKAAMDNVATENRSASAETFFFTNDFRGCCADDLKDLRTEAFRRLGPTAKDSEEARHWDRLFPNSPMPWQRDRIAPWDLKEYAPYLRHLGITLKRKDIPRTPPFDIAFSETQMRPHTPLTLPGAAVAMADQFDASPMRPFAAAVTITPKTAIANGYVTIEFAAPYAAASCDFADCKLASAMDKKFIANQDFLEYLESQKRTVYALEVGTTPITPQRPLHIEVHSNSNPHVVRVKYFDE
jgi:hypothetical protein